MVQRFRGGLVFKAHRLLYHSTLGLRGTKKEKEERAWHLHEWTDPPQRRVLGVLLYNCVFKRESGLLYRGTSPTRKRPPPEDPPRTPLGP